MKVAGEKCQENDLIFPSEIVTISDRDNIRKDFKRLLKEAGLPAIRFHDLRHTGASLLLNNGIPCDNRFKTIRTCPTKYYFRCLRTSNPRKTERSSDAYGSAAYPYSNPNLK
jgi:integrase